MALQYTTKTLNPKLDLECDPPIYHLFLWLTVSFFGSSWYNRDLKPENILMASDKVESPMYQVVKIADFGLSSMKGDLLEDTVTMA